MDTDLNTVRYDTWKAEEEEEEAVGEATWKEAQMQMRVASSALNPLQ